MNTNSQINLPPFLIGIKSLPQYRRWLTRRAIAHALRDHKRGIQGARVGIYKDRIHRAIISSHGVCAYTGKKLDWKLIGQFDNRDARMGGRKFMKKFARLPTVDHIWGKGRIPKFRICSWVVNDAKSHMSVAEFNRLCSNVLLWAEKRRK